MFSTNDTRVEITFGWTIFLKFIVSIIRFLWKLNRGNEWPASETTKTRTKRRVWADLSQKSDRLIKGQQCSARLLLRWSTWSSRNHPYVKLPENCRKKNLFSGSSSKVVIKFVLPVVMGHMDRGGFQKQNIFVNFQSRYSGYIL